MTLPALESETRPTVEAEPDFRRLTSELRTKYTELWCSTDVSTPVIGEPVARRAQRETAKEAERLLDHLFAHVDHLLGSEGDRAAWRESYKKEIRRFGEEHLGWPTGYRRWVFGDALYDATIQFVRKARHFDVQILAEDVGQALRNEWIANSIQTLLDIDVGLSPSIFGYSMLYPYTDNYLDDPGVPLESKRSFNRKLGRRLAGEKVRPVDARQRDVFRLIEPIETQYPRIHFPQVYFSLMAIHRAQTKSLNQQRRDRPPSEAAVLKSSIDKGGASVLADGYLAAGTLTPAEADFCFGYGVFLQLLDDLQDVRTDERARHTTLFTLDNRKGPLDRITSRLYHFMNRALASSSRFASPEFADRKDLILRNCTFLLMGALSEHHDLFTGRYLQALESRWCLDLASMRRLGRFVRKKSRDTTRRLRQRRETNSLAELLLTQTYDSLPGESILEPTAVSSLRDP